MPAEVARTYAAKPSGCRKQRVEPQSRTEIVDMNTESGFWGCTLSFSELGTQDVTAK